MATATMTEIPMKRVGKACASEGCPQKGVLRSFKFTKCKCGAETVKVEVETGEIARRFTVDGKPVPGRCGKIVERSIRVARHLKATGKIEVKNEPAQIRCGNKAVDTDGEIPLCKEHGK